MFLISNCREGRDLGLCTTSVFAFGELLRSGDFRKKKRVSTQEKSNFGIAAPACANTNAGRANAKTPAPSNCASMESVKVGVWNAAVVAFVNTNEREVGACHVAEAASV